MCAGRFCPLFSLPSAALPPLYTAYLRSTTLRNEGGHGVHCARGSAWYPLPTLAQHLGGLTSCLSLCPRFHFAAPTALLPSTDSRVNRVTFHLRFHVSLQPLPPFPAVPILDPVITHASKSLSMATNVAHLSNRWKAHWKKEEENMEGSEKAKENKRMWTNALAWASLPSPSFFPFSFDPTMFLCACVSGQVCPF